MSGQNLAGIPPSRHINQKTFTRNVGLVKIFNKRISGFKACYIFRWLLHIEDGLSLYNSGTLLPKNPNSFVQSLNSIGRSSDWVDWTRRVLTQWIIWCWYWRRGENRSLWVCSWANGLLLDASCLSLCFLASESMALLQHHHSLQPLGSVSPESAYQALNLKAKEIFPPLNQHPCTCHNTEALTNTAVEIQCGGCGLHLAIFLG